MADLARSVSHSLAATSRGTYRFSVEEYHKLGDVGILGETYRDPAGEKFQLEERLQQRSLSPAAFPISFTIGGILP